MSLSPEEQLIFNYFKLVSVSEAEDTENVFKEIFNISGNNGNSAYNLGTVLASINRVIKNYDLEIVEAIDEVSMEKIHCLICTNTSSVAEKTGYYRRQTCDLLSKIIQECIISENGYVSKAFCMGLTTDNGINNISVEDSLENLIRDKWLVLKGENISLGMRCQLELELIIKKRYPDRVKHCSLCRLFMVQGFTCPRCGKHVHFHCVKKYYKLNKLHPSSRICPICKENTYRMEDEDGEIISPMSEADEPPAKRSKSFMCE